MHYSSFISVQVNGELADYFQSKIRLRQGCSLSPYLFVLCMNVLSARLDKAARDKPFGYHPLCKKISLTHLSFVEGTKNLDKGVITVFDKSAVGLGLKISLEKSTIYMAGEPQATMDAILANFPFERGALHVRYLRLTLMTKSICGKMIIFSWQSVSVLGFNMDKPATVLCRATANLSNQ